VQVVVICCWPVGMLFTFGALLFACRHEILRGTPSVLSHATKFLWMEYTRSWYAMRARPHTLSPESEPLHGATIPSPPLSPNSVRVPPSSGAASGGSCSS
jgi:hypothetical protein